MLSLLQVLLLVPSVVTTAVVDDASECVSSTRTLASITAASSTVENAAVKLLTLHNQIATFAIASFLIPTVVAVVAVVLPTLSSQLCADLRYL
jgi:hypothetical protein